MPKIGIIGGGQLGMLLVDAIYKYNTYYANSGHIEIYVIDPVFDCPCAKDARVNFVHGDLQDSSTLKSFCEMCDAVTYEIEHINVESLIELETTETTVKFYPSPGILKTIQNKMVQKEFYQQHDLPSAKFGIVKNVSECQQLIHDFNWKNHKRFVLKHLTNGYDGRGVTVVNNDKDFAKEFESFILQAPAVIIEEYMEDMDEISVLVGRTAENTVVTWPIVQMVFDPTLNLLDYMFSPSDSTIPKHVQELATNIAVDAVQKLQGVGVFAVEMFVNRHNHYRQTKPRVYINEIAPRPHNSAHHTIHTSNCSVYRFLAQILLGQKPRDSGYCSPSNNYRFVLKNIIGPSGMCGRYQFPDLDTLSYSSLLKDNLYFTNYKKTITKPGRKIGHITYKPPAGDVVGVEYHIKLLNNFAEQFVKAIRPVGAAVGVVMGSTSDWSTMKEACVLLDTLKIAYEKWVVSAHRTPDRLYEYAKTAKERGLTVIIAGAGGAAHLPGMLASMTNIPVIGVPIKTSSLSGVDSLHSIVQMPPGVPVATVAIGGATNAGILAAQIIATSDTALYDRLNAYKQTMKQNVMFSANKLE